MELARFFGFTIVSTWLLWLPLVLSGQGLGWLPVTLPMPWVLPGTFCPTLVALWLHRRATGNWRAFTLWPGAVPFGVGLGTGALLIAFAFVVAPGCWLAQGGPGSVSWAALAGFPAATWRALTMAGPLGEEAGWRGYALPRLQRSFGPWRGTLVLGVLWAGWHLPLFLIPGYGGGSFMNYLALVAALAFVMTMAWNLSRGSLPVAILLHAVFNASGAILGGFIGEGGVRPSSAPLTTIVVCFWVLAGVLLVVTRGRLAWRQAPAPADPQPVVVHLPRG